MLRIESLIDLIIIHLAIVVILKGVAGIIIERIKGLQHL